MKTAVAMADQPEPEKDLLRRLRELLERARSLVER
jgi:hypothetical protein